MPTVGLNILICSDEDEIQPYTHHNNTETPKTLFDLSRNYAKHSSSSSRPVVNCNPIIHEASPSPSMSSQQWPTNLGVENKQVELMSSLCQSLLDQQRQNMPNQFSPNFPNYQWCANYMQTQHTLMLNTVSQCCQLLWSQQQDINNLMNSVAMVSIFKIFILRVRFEKNPYFRCNNSFNNRNNSILKLNLL